MSLVGLVAVLALLLQLRSQVRARMSSPTVLPKTEVSPHTIEGSSTVDHDRVVQDPPPSLAPMSPPEVPADLVEACIRGECVLYAGAGLSARANLPTWNPFIRGLLDWSLDEGYVEQDFGNSLRSALARGSTDRVADSIVSKVRERQGLDKLGEYLHRTFVEPNPQLPDVHQILPDIGFTAALTTNFDILLERAFEGRTTSGRAQVFTPRDVEALREALHQRAFFVLKLYGDLSRPGSLLVAPAQYEETLQGDRPFWGFMEQLFFTRTILFLGSTVEGIEAYLRGLPFQETSSRRHYALLAFSEPGWEAEADQLERRYRIHVIPYRTSPDHPEVPRFVEDLLQARRTAERATTTSVGLGPETAAPGPGTPDSVSPRLVSIEIRNIGPFDELRLDFDIDTGWTILVGDNGVGKSTVLKALAVAVAGESATNAAGRLLKAGAPEKGLGPGNGRRAEKGEPSDRPAAKRGEIVVKATNGESYKTHIFLNSVGQPEVRPIGPRAFGGSTLVLGFPPTRTVTPGPTKGPELKQPKAVPTADDVLPLLVAMPDPRILNLKQWIVNLDYRRSRKGEDAERASAVLRDFETKAQAMLGGMKVENIRVVDNDVFATTQDGDLPIDVLSQGTVSILGWIAVLMQRLSEVTASDGRAVVLVDEIDAHMHPEWQQAIVSRLRDAFPHVQFVVTTHSPFLAVGRKSTEVVVLRREPVSRQVIPERPHEDTKGMSVANMLMSPVFGLRSNLDGQEQTDLFRKRELSVRPNLSQTELGELATLEGKLGDLDSTSMIRDPLYKLFVEAMTERHRDALAGSRPSTREEMERQRHAAREVLDSLPDEQGDAALPAEGDAPRSREELS